MNQSITIVLIWTGFTAFCLVWDIIRYNKKPFWNHKVTFAARVIAGLCVFAWVVITGYSLLETAAFALFLPFWFNWIFDSGMGIRIKGNPFYVGTTSDLDDFQRRFNPIAVWMIKAAIAIVSMSIIINESLGWKL